MEKIEKILDNKKNHISYLEQSHECDDSEDSDFGNLITNQIIDPVEQSRLISKTWEGICQPNKGKTYSNRNTKLVSSWFKNVKTQFQPDKIISLNNLREDHPILRQVSFTELIYHIRSLKNNSPGMSGITANLIKLLPVNYIKEIKFILDCLISTKYYPLIFKISKTVFILKPGKNKHDPLSYRPISLLEILAKLYEKIISNRLLYYFEHNNLLSPRQFGFRPCRSTEQSINLITETLLENKRQKKLTLIVTRDVEKAFDRMWHQGLLYKLNKTYKLEIEVTALFHNYLTNRKINPYFNNIQGPSFSPQAGVPQGSCLGPVLFIIFVNDAPKPIFKDTYVNQFADDMIHVIRSDHPGPNKIENARSKLKKELKSIEIWENNWKIKTNTSKIKIGVFGTKLEIIEAQGGIKINNVPIQLQTSIKILGFIINNSGICKSHIKTIESRSKYTLAKFNRFKSAPNEVKLHLYKALVLPILEYPTIQLNNSCKTYISTLQKIQNKALRFVLGLKISDRIPTKTIHEKLKMEPINIRLSKQSRKQLNTMKELYITNQNNNDLVCCKLIANGYFFNHNPPIKSIKPTSVYSIEHNIFQYYLDHHTNIHNYPDNWDDWQLPPPQYA